MKKYYELNPKSPYYKYMQNTDVENALTDDEKWLINYNVRCSLLFNEWESEPIPDDRKNFLIYCALNSVPEYDVFCILVKNDIPKRIIKKYNLLRKWEE